MDKSTAFSWRSLLQSQRTKLAASIVALALLLAALIAVVQAVSLAEIWTAIHSAHGEWVLAAVVLIGLSQVLRIVRFRRLLEWDQAASMQMVCQTTLGGQVINWLSPVRIGDIWRAWRASQKRPGSLLWTASAVVVEKSADSLVLAAFAGVLLLSPLPEGFSVPVIRLLATALGGALLISGLSVFSSSRFRQRLMKFVPQVETWLHAAGARTTLPANLGLRQNARRWLEMLVYSAAIWGVAVLTNVALAYAFDIHIGPISHVLLLLALQTTSVFSPVPGNVGIFSLVSLGVLTPIGIGGAEALAYGSVLYVLVYGTLLLATAAAFIPTWRTQSPSSLPVQNAPHP